MRRNAIAIAGVVVFLALSVLLVVEAPRVEFHGDERLMVALAAASFVAGLAVGRWEALLLILVPLGGAAVRGSWGVVWEVAYSAMFFLALGTGLRRFHIPRRPPRMLVVGVLAAYVVAFSLVTYVVLDTKRADDPFWSGWTSLVVLLGVPFVTGVLLGEWWATLLSVVPFLLSLPAEDNTQIEGEYAGAAFVLGFGVPFFFAAIAAGVGLRRLSSRRQPAKTDPAGV